MKRIIVILEQPEYSALLVMAADALRDPRDQIRFVLRQALEEHGLLQPGDIDQYEQYEQEVGENVRH